MDNNTTYKRLHVLVIDDNAILLRTVREMLSERFDVSIATSGAQAFMAIGKNVPDIIFLDYEMPYSDGESVIKKLHTTPETANVPVIFFTGSADRDIVTKLLSLNPAGYMLKPPNKEKMIDVIRKTLAKAEQNDTIIPETDAARIAESK